MCQLSLTSFAALHVIGIVLMLLSPVHTVYFTLVEFNNLNLFV